MIEDDCIHALFTEQIDVLALLILVRDIVDNGALILVFFFGIIAFVSCCVISLSIFR